MFQNGRILSKLSWDDIEGSERDVEKVHTNEIRQLPWSNSYYISAGIMMFLPQYIHITSVTSRFWIML